ncbi:MAG: hypothetical protein ACI4VS_03810 [Candidatus Nanosyncoccaceae bacterium]
MTKSKKVDKNGRGTPIPNTNTPEFHGYSTAILKRKMFKISYGFNGIEFEIALVKIKAGTKRHAYQYPSGALIE